jgi:hypothetical protein
MRARPVFVIAAALAPLVARPARAYEEWLHEVLPDLALPAGDPWLTAPVASATPEQLAAFRRHVFGLWEEVWPPFQGRYASADAFDAWAFKHFLTLEPAREVWGIDRVHEAGERSRLALLALGSRCPDDDRRNQDRVLYGPDRQVLADPWGRPLPADPAILHLGAATGLSSQAHAHYGLAPPPLSDDPEVLKREPWRFATPPEAHGFATDFASLYSDLSMLATLWGEPGGEWLAMMYAGAAWHHVADVANQVHTVQVGIYDFFVDARMRAWKEDLLSLGGLLYARPAFRDIGIGILTNHHLVSERLFADRVREVVAGRAPAGFEGLREALTRDDPAVSEHLDAVLGEGLAARGEADVGYEVATAVVAASYREGPEVYRLMHAAGARRMRAVGAGFQASDDPAPWVRDDAAARSALGEMYALQRRGLGRAATALRRWLREVKPLGDLPPEVRPAVRRQVAQRAVARLTQHHDEAERRRRAWAPEPPAGRDVEWRWAGGVAAVAGLVVGAFVRARVRAKR